MKRVLKEKEANSLKYYSLNDLINEDYVGVLSGGEKGFYLGRLSCRMNQVVFFYPLNGGWNYLDQTYKNGDDKIYVFDSWKELSDWLAIKK